MAPTRVLFPAALLAVLLLVAGRLGPCESRAQEAAVTGAQEADVMASHEVERMQALNEGGDPRREAVRWRSSRALGLPYAGRLVEGVQLPLEGSTFFTWDPIHKTVPNREWRRYGTDRLVRTLLEVLGEFQDEHPDATRVGVGDLSRPHGGDFGPRFGYPGHASHQNGLDVDVYYPRRDRLERAPLQPAQVDRVLAQDLVDRFVDAGAKFVFVGYRTGMRGPDRVVQEIPNHNDHMHVRLWP